MRTLILFSLLFSLPAFATSATQKKEIKIPIRVIDGTVWALNPKPTPARVDRVRLSRKGAIKKFIAYRGDAFVWDRSGTVWQLDSSRFRRRILATLSAFGSSLLKAAVFTGGAYFLVEYGIHAHTNLNWGHVYLVVTGFYMAAHSITSSPAYALNTFGSGANFFTKKVTDNVRSLRFNRLKGDVWVQYKGEGGRNGRWLSELADPPKANCQTWLTKFF